jgi:retron-type reverse transcriptase
MKRYGKLWSNLVSFENLLRAAEKACRGKRLRPAVARFNFELERELWTLHEELVTRTYRPGAYRTFYIYEPKKRQISAAPYRDRVVHHALVNVLEPIFERTFIYDSYACRRCKGTHAAVTRCQQYARRFRYVLKADIQKFFPSVDHEILQDLIARKIKDACVQWLVEQIVTHSNTQEPVLNWFRGDTLFTPTERRRGMPIGNQTSQFFANVYLDPLDHFVKDRLRINGYARYVDDFLVFSHDKRVLRDVQSQISDFLIGLRLRLHSRKNVVFPVSQGIRFLGYRVFPTHRLLVKDNVWRFRRRLQRMQRAYAERRLSAAEVGQRILSWIGHAGQANTYRLRSMLFDRFPFQRATAVPPCVAGRLVQQSTDERSVRQP